MTMPSALPLGILFRAVEVLGDVWSGQELLKLGLWNSIKCCFAPVVPTHNLHVFVRIDVGR